MWIFKFHVDIFILIILEYSHEDVLARFFPRLKFHETWYIVGGIWTLLLIFLSQTFLLLFTVCKLELILRQFKTNFPFEETPNVTLETLQKAQTIHLSRFLSLSGFYLALFPSTCHTHGVGLCVCIHNCMFDLKSVL